MTERIQDVSRRAGGKTARLAGAGVSGTIRVPRNTFDMIGYRVSV